jgi:hypothetical protein
MRKILMLGLLTASSAMAEGIFTFKQPLVSNKDLKNEASLFVVENLTTKLTYQSWTGFTFGDYTQRKSEHALLINFKDSIQAGPYLGAAYDSSLTTNRAEQYGGVMLQMKLWK